MSSRTEVFTRRVSDVRKRGTLSTSPERSVKDVIGQMTADHASAVVIIDDEGRPVGIFTEADATRRVALRATGDESVSDLMTAPVDTVAEGEYLYAAVARMQREGRRHLPVVDGNGRLTGVLDLHDALSQCARETVDQIQTLTQTDSIDGLTARKIAQAVLARQLAEENLPVDQIQALISQMNADTYARIIDMQIAAMADEGLGSPPVDFDVITMGSGARGESMMYPDQDNGFVLADYSENDHAEIDVWFIELAERMTRSLDTVGIPLCTGFVMATNPLWRKPIADWRRQLDFWFERRTPNLLRHTEIICDFAPVWGSGALAAELRQMFMAAVTGNDPVLRGIGSSDGVHGPALTWFGGFITVKDPSEYRGYVNLKHYGTLPVVSGARLMALRAGISDTSTLLRLSKCNEQGGFKHDAYDELVAAYRLSASVLLHSQIDEFEEGRKVTNFVDPKALTRRQRGDLKRAFKAIRNFHGRIRFEFAGEVF
ncbi:MAG: DUF294 nucleotidyltransferase-like domain-containing protein [Rhodospirillales bacterium]